MNVRLCSLLAIVSACGSSPNPDKAVVRGPVTTLDLLPSDEGGNYNHSNEVQIAVNGDRVAVAYLNLRFVSENGFETDESFGRKLAVAVSNDGGDTFAPPNAPPFGAQTTDPNIRVSPDGRFWLATFDFIRGPTFGAGIIAHSEDAITWVPVLETYFGDKNWMAIDPDVGSVFVGAVSGFWRVDDGMVTEDSSGGALVGGYARNGRASFTRFTRDLACTSSCATVLDWNGSSPHTERAYPAKLGDTFYHLTSLPIGPTSDGGEWFLRSVGTTEVSPLKVFYAPLAGPSEDIWVSAPDSITFLPAADTDAQGRLHIVYYDSKGPAGRVLYTHSISSDFTEGFIVPIVIDDNATPALFFPGFPTQTGDRRLREYIDIQVSGSRAYIAWTHAPTAPSRVQVTYIVFD